MNDEAHLLAWIEAELFVWHLDLAWRIGQKRKDRSNN